MQTEPKTRRGRESRGRIVQCAAELIAERGVERMGLDQVIAAASVSKSQLYHYFADRDALIEAAVSHRCTEVQAALTHMFGGLDSLAELEQRLERFVAIYEESLAGCPVGRIAGEVAGRHEGVQRQIGKAFADWEGLFAELFRRMRQRHEMRPETDPAALATALLAALEGGQLISQTRKDATSLRVAIAAALGYIRTFAT
jgi:TetR/AcrR family transcriptional regulator, transcriptional repressor for nem operon